MEKIKNIITQSIKVKQEILANDEFLKMIETISNTIVDSLKNVLQYQQIDSPTKISTRLGLMPDPTGSILIDPVKIVSPRSAPSSSSNS